MSDLENRVRALEVELADLKKSVSAVTQNNDFEKSSEIALGFGEF